MLVARNLSKEYRSGDSQLAVLRNVSFSIQQGELVAIVGPSGSGKTTLLGLLAGLDTPSSGSVVLDGSDLGRLDEDARAQLRGEKVGFIFQSFQLIPTLTALENVQAKLAPTGLSEVGLRQRAEALLAEVGLAQRADHLPAQLSGGEQQRVAIARALSVEPHVILADEPTGNLDSTTGSEIVDILAGLAADRGATVIVATHDAGLAGRAQRRLGIRDGRLAEAPSTVVLG